ncbi:MAG: protein phosphatase 2C domain-containing protein [Lachnospiraceae bacterium]|nr:protein phosphatase 2C domain-containing protein [Lachnospiraceae bacterium]
MKYLSSAYWDAGSRNRNEDSLLLEVERTFRGQLIYGMVCDGIGSLEEGEKASGYILEEIHSIMEEKVLPKLINGRSLFFARRILLQAIFKLYKQFAEYAVYKNINLGSTFSFLIIFKKRFLIIHLGDSAIIKIKRNKSKIITPIHHNTDGSLSHCIGNCRYQKPYVASGFIHRNEGFLICTDGFIKRKSDYAYGLNPKDIESEEQIEIRLKEIGKKLKKLGEKDNISAIYIVPRKDIFIWK